MSISPKGFTIHEGYNDLGTFEIDITNVEQPTDNPVKVLTDAPPIPRSLLFKLELLSGLPVPLEYRGVFTVKGRVESEWVTYEQYPNADGFIQIDTPVLPVVVRTFEDATETTVIRLNIEGALNERAEEMYLEVNGGGSTMYTLIWDLFVADGELAIFDGDATYYPLANPIAVGADITAIHITTLGVVYGYDSVLVEWTELGTLRFSMIEFPENLTSFSDGFYQTNGDTGSVTTDPLGTGAFEFYTSVVTNPGSYYVDVLVNVFLPGTLVYTHEFTFVTPGSPNYIPVVIDGTPYVAPDLSPTISDIQTISGVTFSAEFLDFLALKSLGTLEDVRKAGPIKFIDGFPSEDVGPEELATLQSHTDLYTVNKDAEINQHLMAEGYGRMYDIANTPKDVFVTDVVNEDLNVFRAAQIHEVVTQNQKLVSNMLANRMSDMRMAESSIPFVPGNNFPAAELHAVAASCGCNDCKSGISPFAYLTDLLKYGASHINNISVEDPYERGGTPAKLTSFIGILEDNFLQPFGGLDVSCETLHDEFCRVRLVTEVLEKQYIIKAAMDPPVLPAVNGPALDLARQKYLTLVYKAILTQAGTSINEVRDIVAMPVGDEKTKAVERFCNKLCLPIYVPSSSTLTVEAIWLTLGNTNPSNDLTRQNLEALFGFRDTLRNVLTVTPVGDVVNWRSVELKNIWKKYDYLFTDYSREDVDPTDGASFKSNWKPIIDPDNIGWQDMTYQTGTFAKELWAHRKAEIDRLLNFCVNDSTMVSEISLDENLLILKVNGIDISTDVIEDDTIYYEYPAATWDPYVIFGKSLKGTNTDVILDKAQYPFPAVQPVGPSPKMKYNKVVLVVTTIIPASNTFTLTWPDDVILNWSSTPYAKLISTGDPTVFQTSDASLTVNSQTSTSVNITVSGPNSDFCDGTVSFIYEAEVPLVSEVIMDPEKLTTEMFMVQQSYTLFPPAFTTPDPAPYWLWVNPTWPGSITALTNVGRLIQMQDQLAAGIDVDTFTTIITSDLRMSTGTFTRTMEIIRICDNYVKSIFTAVKPTVDELYELASILETCGKTQLQALWVQEEIQYPDPMVSPEVLMLSGNYFWKSMSEPLAGAWDPRFQTIPDNTGDMSDKDIPIIDPELLAPDEMLRIPESVPYTDLYDIRKGILDVFYDTLLAYVIPYAAAGFTSVLNRVSTGNPVLPYDISPYANLNALLADLESNDPFKYKQASDVAMFAFSIGGEEFLSIGKVIQAYESANPATAPSVSELQKTLKPLVTAYKKRRLYPTIGSTIGWIEEEIAGGFFLTTGYPVKYYNVRKMNLAPARANTDERAEWQRTLAAWNRMPFIQPDIVPPENVVNFTLSNPIYTTWNLRKIALITAYNTLTSTYIYPGAGNADDLLLNLQGQIDLIVARLSTYTPLTPPFVYYPFFEAIRTHEANGDDIRPYISQFGITPTEYRYLADITKVLEGAGSGPIPLLDTEYEDIKNIIIAIRSRNLTFTDVLDEYDDDIILSPEYFQNYKPALNNFPLTDLEAPNAWRSPNKLRKDWKDLLQSRIERKKAIEDEWKEVLKEAEDQNMPFLRDSLIKALTNTCLNWQDTAEKLAKTFFIETKDNCCFKHTRVSFALETLQGFYFSLANGIFDDFVANFKLVAPDFKREWEWLGTYSAWRSAMFVFLYPENLLYPTLKRLQSPKFIELSQKLQAANRFSPENACDAAQSFQEYLTDVQDLEIICSTSSRTRFVPDDVHDCCNTSDYIEKNMTYFFAQSKKTKKAYWSSKETASLEGNGFWEALPIETKDITVLGCYVVGSRWDNWTTRPLALMLFYTYLDKGKLKMAYIKKELFDTKANWSAPTDTEDIPCVENGKVAPAYITASQQSADFEMPVFIFSFHQVVTKYKVIIIEHPWRHTMFPAPAGWENQLTIPTNSIESQTERAHIPFIYNYEEDKFDSYETSTYNNEDKPFTAISYLLFNTAHSEWKLGISMVFSYGINYGWLGKKDMTNFPVTMKNIYGAFEYRPAEDNAIILYYKNAPGTDVAVKITLPAWDVTSNPTVGFNFYSSIVSPTLPQRILPFFQEKDAPRMYAFKDNVDTCFGITIDTSTAFTLGEFYMLKPYDITGVTVESADCIADMPARATAVKTQIQKNMAAPGGTLASWKKSSKAIRELLNEAYYFVPMLLALDQQKRGQFEAALSWYRSVYDYTIYGQSQRKVFYGLRLEETIVNSYAQNAGWLLDPLNPHLIAQTRTNAYTKYTIMNIVQCMFAYADREYTLDTIETLPVARKLYTTALELLRVKEINLKANLCEANANNCLTTLVPELAEDPTWSNQTARLQNNLQRVGNPETIDTLAEEIAALFVDVPEEDMAEKFAEAFEMIDEELPPAPEPEDVTAVTTSSADRFNSAYSYIFASGDQSNFTAEVENNYARVIAEVSGLDVSELQTTDGSEKLVWLYSAPTDNDQPLDFEFATSEGVQFMAKTPYDPLKPSPRSYSTSFTYYNAPYVIGQYQNNMPVGYTPLLDYKFCMPSNPVYSALNMKGNLELYKMFNCRNIAGMIRELDVYSAATDTVTGMPVIGASGNLSTPAIGTYTPSQYRFRVLIERAKQIAAQAQQMESMFLAALEKEDAENYSQLRARQDLETARATVKLQDLRIKQANDERVTATLQLDKVTFMQSHFADQLANGLNSFEKNSLELMVSSIVLNFGAAALNTIASGLFQGDLEWDNGMVSLASAASSTAAALSGLSSFNAQMASFQRRAEEWTFQKDLAGFDISLANQQIKVADDNIRVVTQERQIAQLNTEHAQESLQFLQNKFTNAELYSWMGTVLQSSYSYMLNLSNSIARTAEKQLYFERQEQAGPFILDDYWETPSSGFTSGSSGSSVDRRGLTGSARLLVDITRLDQYAFDSFKRKLQMTKVISLAQNFPSEFQHFKETGVMNFELTNKLFDYDFPGHYLRLITQVKTTVVGLLPVYDQIKASLTADNLSYTVIGGTTFQRIPIKRLELDSVALTSANNATGVFEMQPMQNELLNPFEGMGVESRWEFKMPQFSNRFDFSNIADVLISVDYTAFDSYQYRTQVLQDLDYGISFNRGFSFKNNFPDQWYELAEAETTPTATIELKREMFPQGIDNLKLNGTSMLLYFVRENYDGEITILNFNLPSNTSGINDDTENGVYNAGALTTALSNVNNGTPLVKLKLTLDNSAIQLFADGKIKDIILLMPCKAELRNYPL